VELLACTGESINAHKMSVINSESKMSVLRLRVGGESMILKWPEGSRMSKCKLGSSGSE
jgi:hypothetical protein